MCDLRWMVNFYYALYDGIWWIYWHNRTRFYQIQSKSLDSKSSLRNDLCSHNRIAQLMIDCIVHELIASSIPNTIHRYTTNVNIELEWNQLESLFFGYWCSIVIIIHIFFSSLLYVILSKCWYKRYFRFSIVNSTDRTHSNWKIAGD